MEIEQEKIIAVLSQLNPWWRGQPNAELPEWRRAVFAALSKSVTNQPTSRAVFLAGARQVGKTTLMLQLINDLISKQVSPANILYLTLDHPVLRLAGIDAALKAWRDRIPQAEGLEYLLIDEAQLIDDWDVWIKHQVDFQKKRQIVFTGSAIPLRHEKQESGVGRWHTIRLATLSFSEYLQIRRHTPPKQPVVESRLVEKTIEYQQRTPPELPAIQPLSDLFAWSQSDFRSASESYAPYVAHFNQYFLRGGFPQMAQLDDLGQIQRLMSEDIVDKILKRDMPAAFGVRSVWDLERVFLYLCDHGGGLLNIAELCKGLGVARPTAENFISLLEGTHLIYRLRPLSYGKKVLRGRFKIYLADAGIAPAVMLTGDAVLDDPAALGMVAETTVLKHLLGHYRAQNAHLSYWREKENHEVDIVAEVAGRLIPYEVKYRNQPVNRRDIKGLLSLCQKKSITQAYVITKSLDDFGLMSGVADTQILRIPALLLCYWLGEAEAKALS